MGNEASEPREAPKEPADAASEEGPRPTLGTFLYRTALAGVGAFVMAQEEIEALLRKLVERGHLDQAEKERLLEETATHSEQERKTISAQVDATIRNVLGSIHVPTRDDVDDLSQRVEKLAERIEALKAKREAGGE